MLKGHSDDYEQFSDEELARLSGSDKAALGALLCRYMGTAEHIAAKLAPRNGREQIIKDLVQEGMMALLKAVNSYRPDRGAHTRQHVCTAGRQAFRTDRPPARTHPADCSPSAFDVW